MTDATAAPRACIIGWPVAHSRSPLIHGHWLKQYGLPGSYGRIAVPPEEAEAFFRGFAASGYAGGNVTVPHKAVALAACDHLEPAAVAIGAVNTLWVEGGKLLGTNTDGVGFLASLDEAAPGWDGRPGDAVVLGAGGGARAIVWALVERGFRPRIVNRTRARAEELAAAFGRGATAHDWSEADRLLDAARLLVNTTSLGMGGEGAIELDLAALPADARVADIVYVPLETPLLAAARARGLVAVDGLGMLLHQAAPGFRRWFGVDPAVTPALRALVLADIEGAKP